jgi:hypothetical protein
MARAMAHTFGRVCTISRPNHHKHRRTTIIVNISPSISHRRQQQPAKRMIKVGTSNQRAGHRKIAIGTQRLASGGRIHRSRE